MKAVARESKLSEGEGAVPGTPVLALEKIGNVLLRGL